MTARRPLVVLDVVGLTPRMLGARTPALTRLANDGFTAPLAGVFPAVTCSAQSSMLTGLEPTDHGIVGNGWYFRELAEVLFWRQANQLVHGDKVWETAARRWPGFKAGKLFWWYNMYSSAAFSVTPRPVYPADGRKLAALSSNPPELERQLVDALGEFPFFDFWGPKSGLKSSQWIAESAKLTLRSERPDLLLVYLPHLDYNLQRLGPSDPRVDADIRAIDAVAGAVIDAAREHGADVLVVSEYGIEQATGHVHINKVLREHGFVAVRETLGWEMLDAGASRAFAVADHQVAHVYVREARDVDAVARLLRATAGVGEVLDRDGKRRLGVDHARAGELVAVAAPGHWFTYYYWLDDAKAPDFARTVDIHRKPGYDPAELFVDPELRVPALRIGRRVLQKKLGFRMLMDVIPLKPELVKGTHGRLPASADDGPVVIGSRRDLALDGLAMTGVKDLILRHWD
jgi:predicted AlkP superfamily pyrophosphatase or phosphodiesterase